MQTSKQLCLQVPSDMTCQLCSGCHFCRQYCQCSNYMFCARATQRTMKQMWQRVRRSCSKVFQSLDVYFQPLLKEQKTLMQKSAHDRPAIENSSEMKLSNGFVTIFTNESILNGSFGAEKIDSPFSNELSSYG